MTTPRRGTRPPSQRAPLALCYGTRPQVIKASRLVEVLSRRWDLCTIDTGQHYDYALNALVYEQLNVRNPDLLLEVGSHDHATQTSRILVRSAKAFRKIHPWVVVVIGDTNSTLGCALAAAQLRIPVVHVEAGLRAADTMMAEDMNRRVVDAVSSLLCAPSEAAERRLQLEHVSGSVVFTGDVARDVLDQSVAGLRPGARPADWPLGEQDHFVFATLHRAELVDHPERLAGVLGALGRLELPAVLAMHPRTRAVLERRRLAERVPPRVHIMPALGYLDAIACIRDARAVVTDSGGIQREAYWLGTPCVTVRAETEWPETVRLGANTLVPPERAPDELPAAVKERRRRQGLATRWNRDAYGVGDAAVRIEGAISLWAAGGGHS
jgi:UDP-GlcNAc3NAcA epimerase